VYLLSDIKRLDREGEHSPPPSAKDKDMWSYISVPPYVFMAWFLCAEMLPCTLYQIDCRICSDDSHTQCGQICHLFLLTYRDITDCPVKCWENQSNNQLTKPNNPPSNKQTNQQTNQAISQLHSECFFLRS
jgi:hypothetical protein